MAEFTEVPITAVDVLHIYLLYGVLVVLCALWSSFKGRWERSHLSNGDIPKKRRANQNSNSPYNTFSFAGSTGSVQSYNQDNDANNGSTDCKADDSSNGRSQEQWGYTSCLPGRLLSRSVIASAVASQVLLGLCLWMEWRVPFSQTHLYWDTRAKSFVLVWCLSAVILFGLKLFEKHLNTFFLLRSSLEDATHVAVWKKDDDEISIENCQDAVMRWVNKWRRAMSLWMGAGRPGGRTFHCEVKTTAEGLRYFDLQCTRYMYSKGEFRPCEGEVHQTGRSLRAQVDRGGLTENEVHGKRSLVGYNRIHVEVPSLLTSASRELSDGIYIFQLFCFWVGLHFRNVISALVWFGLVCWSVAKKVVLLRSNQKSVQEMAEQAALLDVMVVRNQQLVTVKAAETVPGDVVVIEDSWMVPCDIALLSGQVVVDESSLTGESMPVQKFPLAPEQDDTLLHPDKAKKHFLFAGTKALKVNSAPQQQQQQQSGQSASPSRSGSMSSQNTGMPIGCGVGVAVRTGTSTSRGQLVRNILFPNTLRFKYDEQLPVVFVVLCIYAAVIFLVQSYYLGFGIASFFYGVGTISQVVPIWTAVLLAIGQNVASQRLKEDNQITCLAPARIAICGKVRVMCFDKTGTLTKEYVDFIGVHPIKTNKKSPPVFTSPILVAAPPSPPSTRDNLQIEEEDESGSGSSSPLPLPSTIPDVVLRGLACCHSLTLLCDERTPVSTPKTFKSSQDATLIGNELERRMFMATGWVFEEWQDKAKGAPRVRVRAAHSDGYSGAEVLQAFEFDHGRQTMSVVTKNLETVELAVYCKGSYENIAKLCPQGSGSGHPLAYFDVANGYAKQGIYVLALATKTLPKNTPVDTPFARDDIEKDLTLLGLILFRNELKPESPDAIRSLKAGRVRPVMITGDNALTAVTIARNVGMMADTSPATSASADISATTTPTAAATATPNRPSLKHQQQQRQRQGSKDVLWDADADLSPQTKQERYRSRRKLSADPLPPQQPAEVDSSVGRVVLGSVKRGGHGEGAVVEWRDVDTNDVVSEAQIYHTEEFQDLAVTQEAYDWLCSHNYVPEASAASHDRSDETTKLLAAEGQVRIPMPASGQQQLLIDKLLLRIRIFARMTPAGKVRVIKAFMNQGFITGMCGDGGNDCGALRAAHAGVALSEAEASIVSPFCARSKSPLAVVDLLREGRGSLVTSLACYKFMVMYGLLITLAKVVLFSLANSIMPELGYFYFDILIDLGLAYAMTLCRPKNRLRIRTPTSSLLGPHTVVSIVAMMAINTGFLWLMFVMLRAQGWYTPALETSKSYPIWAWWMKSDNYETACLTLWLGFQLINAALIFSFGGMFRENVFKNRQLTLWWAGLNLGLLYCMFAGPNMLTCLFRLNCDDATSRATVVPFLPRISFMGRGGPFYGPDGHNIFPWSWKAMFLLLNACNVLINIVFYKYVMLGAPAQYYRQKGETKFKAENVPV